MTRLPALTSIDAISPSALEDLLTCGLRLAFRRDRRFSDLRRGNPASALGLVAHDLAEIIAPNQVEHIPGETAPETASRLWDETIVEAVGNLSAQWPEREMPPPHRWPNYQRIRTRSVRRLTAILHRQAAESLSATGPAPTIETELRIEGFPLKGRPDRIEHHSEGPEVVDVKSTPDYDEISDAHRRQLLSYALLWHASTGEWPTRASIQTLDGQRFSFDIDPAEAERLLDHITGVLDRYNADVIAAETPAALATPSPDACQYCPYRIRCGPFFAAIDPGWDLFTRSFAGSVLSRDDAGQHAAIRVAVTSADFSADEGEAHLRTIPRVLAPDIGDEITVVDAYAERSADHHLRFRWNTQLESRPADPYIQ